MVRLVNEDIANKKILVVGAGGIGCELLKNLVLTGFAQIHVVDLDTIELSNLNRQFLFQRQHIGKAKAIVAAEAVKRLNPKVEVHPYFANIKNTNLFPISFFQSFDIVLNALDNLDARSYVNNICIAIGVQLVESGTAGYLGQTGVIKEGFECFDCTPKERPKTFPVCTIRTTPSAPIHCVVWAKEYLLAQLFAESSEEPTPDTQDQQIVQSLKAESEAYQDIRNIALDKDANKQAFSEAVLEKVFVKDIEAIFHIKELWDNKIPPMTLVMPESLPDEDQDLDDQQVWSIPEWIMVFKRACGRLRDRAFASGTLDQIFFDKDDEEVMDFVAAAANLRAHLFSIPLTCRFSLKSMAGNIISAIATTNAIVAGMIVIQAINVLAGQEKTLCNCYITFGTRRGTLFAMEEPSPPNPSCPVCIVDHCMLWIDTERSTLCDLMRIVLNDYTSKGEVDMTEDVTLIEGSRIIYDPDMTINAQKTLKEINCGDSKFVKFDFSTQDVPLLVTICHQSDAILATEEATGQKPVFRLLPAKWRFPKPVDTATDAIAAVHADSSKAPTAKMARIMNDGFQVIAIDDDISIIT